MGRCVRHVQRPEDVALSETDTLVDPDVMDQWGTKWAYAAAWAPVPTHIFCH